MAALVAARGCLAPLLTTKPKHEGGMRRAEIGSLAKLVGVAQAQCLAQHDGCCMGCGASPDHGASADE
jgi:hypothetical protein